jgi:hypothetical protein
MGHVTKYVGGVYETPKTYEQAGMVYEPTPIKSAKRCGCFFEPAVI